MRASSAIAFARAAREKQGFYFRVGHNDHVPLNRLIAERKLLADGLVLDARRHERHEVLRQHAERTDVATCLDTQAMELVMPGTTSKGHTGLPWASVGARSPEEFSPKHIERFVGAIVARVADGAYSRVMAPAHYIDEVSSEWLRVDEALTSELRAQLDASDLESVRIIYPLAVHHSVFYDLQSRAVLIRLLKVLPVDVISLRVHPFGSTSGPLAMRSFIEACGSFRQVDRPLMIERAGIAGVSAYALGAVDFIESGITTGDSFDISSLQRPAVSGKSGFPAAPRIYIEALGSTVECKIAANLFSSPRGRSFFGCKDRACCPNGYQDMLEDAERHSALARQRQYTELSRVPPTMRAEHFIHNVVTPVCDMLARASDLHEPFKKAHRRTLSVKEMLIDLHRQQKELRDKLIAASPAMPPHTGARVIRLTPREPKGR